MRGYDEWKTTEPDRGTARDIHNPDDADCMCDDCAQQREFDVCDRCAEPTPRKRVDGQPLWCVTCASLVNIFAGAERR